MLTKASQSWAESPWTLCKDTESIPRSVTNPQQPWASTRNTTVYKLCLCCSWPRRKYVPIPAPRLPRADRGQHWYSRDALGQTATWPPNRSSSARGHWVTASPGPVGDLRFMRWHGPRKPLENHLERELCRQDFSFSHHFSIFMIWLPPGAERGKGKMLLMLY